METQKHTIEDLVEWAFSLGGQLQERWPGNDACLPERQLFWAWAKAEKAKLRDAAKRLNLNVHI